MTMCKSTPLQSRDAGSIVRGMGLTWQEIQARLARDKGNWSRISRETGIHINGVRKLAIGEIKSPRISTVEKLAAYYARPIIRPAERNAA